MGGHGSNAWANNAFGLGPNVVRLMLIPCRSALRRGQRPQHDGVDQSRPPRWDRRLQSTQRLDLRTRHRVIRARDHPPRKPSRSAGDVSDANQVAMPVVLLQAQPETTDVAFITFDNGKEMNAGEKKHAGDVMALVVEAPQSGGFMKACCRE